MLDLGFGNFVGVEKRFNFFQKSDKVENKSVQNEGSQHGFVPTIVLNHLPESKARKLTTIVFG